MALSGVSIPHHLFLSSVSESNLLTMKSTPKFIPQSIVAWHNRHSLAIITNYKRLVLILKYICFENHGTSAFYE